jgi:superfamily II DNA or RNA helicase
LGRLVGVESDLPKRAEGLTNPSGLSESERSRLLAELAVAHEEIHRLRRENARLTSGRTETAAVSVHRVQRAPELFAPVDDVPHGVDRQSPAEAKVRLYRSLFSGRTDVHALRWENPSTKKSGWSPAKLSGPVQASLGSRRYAPVDDALISCHLAGQLTVGVYPLIEGDRCWFLACDFDKGSWALDSLAFLEVCAQVGVPAALERSRSGNGGHVWIFFERPIAASAARRLGVGLLRETMELRAEVDLGSYDRLFPSQDFVPDKGFGNLIALPLQGRCRKHDTTVFLDPTTLEPWDDQWTFLASIRRLSIEDTESIGEALKVEVGPGTGIGRCRVARPGPDPPLTIPAILGSTLAIDRIGMPPALLASLKHIASVHNPEFHQRQQLRLSTWNTPRMIRCYEEDLDRIYIPRGLTEESERVVRAAGSCLKIDDQRAPAPQYDFEFAGALTAQQEAAVSDMAGQDLGVMVAPTGAGKTVMACALIARLGTPTLVLVHTKPLAEQWHQRLGELLGLNKRQIGQLGGGRTRTSGIVDLVTLQTLARRSDPAEVFAGYGLVIVDECHHLPAVTFERCVRTAPNRRWIGLTATPRRRDGLEAILHMHLGPVRHTMALDAAATVLVRRDLIVHDTVTDPDTDERAPVQVVLGRVAADEERTEQISADIADARRRGRNILVFSDRTEHLQRLRAGLQRRGLHPHVLQGGIAKKDRVRVLAELTTSSDPILLLATGAYLGEGFDLPSLDTLFLTFPISGRTRLVQYVGRVTRALPCKTTVEIHDYHDRLHPLLRRMHGRRLATYKTLGLAPAATRQGPPGAPPWADPSAAPTDG